MTILAGVLAPVMWATPAFACTCDPLTAQNPPHEDAVVFIGTAIEVMPIPQSIAGTLEWTFEVETVLQGELGPLVKVRTGDDSDSCSFSPTPIHDGEALVIHRDGRAWGSGICAIMAAEEAAVFGRPKAPNPEIGETPPIAEPAAVVEPDDWFTSAVERTSSFRPAPLVIAAMVLTAVVLVGASAVYVVLRRRRPTAVDGG